MDSKKTIKIQLVVGAQDDWGVFALNGVQHTFNVTQDFSMEHEGLDEGTSAVDFIYQPSSGRLAVIGIENPSAISGIDVTAGSLEPMQVVIATANQNGEYSEAIKTFLLDDSFYSTCIQFSNGMAMGEVQGEGRGAQYGYGQGLNALLAFMARDASPEEHTEDLPPAESAFVSASAPNDGVEAELPVDGAAETGDAPKGEDAPNDAAPDVSQPTEGAPVQGEPDNVLIALSDLLAKEGAKTRTPA